MPSGAPSQPGLLQSLAVFHGHALEAPLPERSVAFLTLVVPAAEPLIELFDNKHMPHPPE